MTRLFRNIVARETSSFNKKLFAPKPDISDVLEDFESLAKDKYVTVTDEDGTMVPPLACTFCKVPSKSHLLCVVDETGNCVLYNTNKTAQSAVVKVWQAHNNAIFDVDWIQADEKILTASGDQTVALWDVGRGERIDTFRGHTSSVRAVNVQRNSNAVFATGSRDGHIMIWDIRCAKKDGFIQPVNTIRNVHTLPKNTGVKAKRKYKLPAARDSQMSVIDVKFQTETDLWSAGAVDGCVKLWDLRKNYTVQKGESVAKHVFTYSGVSKREHGYSSLVFDSTFSQLFASCTDDVIYQFDAAGFNNKPVHCYHGHQNGTFYIKASISADDKCIVTGSSDEMAYIYQIGKPKQSPIVLKGHTQEVSVVKWSPQEMNKIVTLSDDCMMRVWRIHRRLSPPGPEEVTGTAERTHREIGVTAEEVISNAQNVDPGTSTALSPGNPAQKSGKISDLMKTKSPKLGSPSLKTWFQKAASVVESSDKNESRNISYPSGSNIVKERKTSIFGSERLPCKRKLVDEDDDDRVDDSENPTKRRNILSSPLKAFSPSPRKILSPRKLEIKCSSHKAVLSPELQGRVLRNIGPSLESRLNSPDKSKTETDKKELLKRTALIPQSPTVNLPNLVMEGGVNKVNVRYSANDKENNVSKEQKVDWLTKLRIEKYRPSGEENSDVNSVSKPNLKEKTSPLRLKSSQSSQSSTESSQTSALDYKASPAKAAKGMKSLHHYFKAR